MSGVTWSEESYAWCMGLKGSMNSEAAEYETGIPASTIRGWWNGKTPRVRRYNNIVKHSLQTHCKRGHELNDETARGKPRECRICRRIRQRAYGFRKRGKFHPELNPNVLLAPLHHLWLRGSDILAFIDTRYSRSEVWAQLDKSTGEYGRWSALLSGREWIRYDAADRLFIRIGLVLSEMDVEPHYCRDPRYLPREETPVAA